jgi:hypothetical protein
MLETRWRIGRRRNAPIGADRSACGLDEKVALQVSVASPLSFGLELGPWINLALSGLTGGRNRLLLQLRSLNL